MLTDYVVTCPHPGCHWSGSLLPHQNLDAWRGATPATGAIVFLCPRCRREWHARLVGDDPVPVPLQEMTKSEGSTSGD